jgi:hypothetical protein
MSEPKREPKPRPIKVTVCDICAQPWSSHLSRARRTLREDWYNQLHPDDWGGPPSFTDEQLEEAVSLFDCIEALQQANRGPMGPVGPQGARGNSYTDLYA